MKWFKHFSDNHRGQSIQTLLDELGHMGLCYFLLVEMCAEKLEPKVDQKLTEVDCVFNFHRRVVQQNLRIRPVGLQRLLTSCSTTGLLSFEFIGNTVQISMPILLDLLDSDSKKARSRRVRDAAKSRLDKDIDKDKEEDKEKDISSEVLCAPSPANFPDPQPKQTEANRAVWESYREAYLARYRVEPTRNAKVNTAIANFVKRVGARDGPDVIRFFLRHNDAQYVKSQHSVTLALRDAESLRTQWLRGQPVTANDARQHEQMDHFASQQKRLGAL